MAHTLAASAYFLTCCRPIHNSFCFFVEKPKLINYYHYPFEYFLKHTDNECKYDHDELSDHNLISHHKCTDNRVWSLDEQQQRQHFHDIIHHRIPHCCPDETPETEDEKPERRKPGASQSETPVKAAASKQAGKAKDEGKGKAKDKGKGKAKDKGKGKAKDKGKDQDEGKEEVKDEGEDEVDEAKVKVEDEGKGKESKKEKGKDGKPKSPKGDKKDVDARPSGEENLSSECSSDDDQPEDGEEKVPSVKSKGKLDKVKSEKLDDPLNKKKRDPDKVKSSEDSEIPETLSEGSTEQHDEIVPVTSDESREVGPQRTKKGMKPTSSDKIGQQPSEASKKSSKKQPSEKPSEASKKSSKKQPSEKPSEASKKSSKKQLSEKPSEESEDSETKDVVDLTDELIEKLDRNLRNLESTFDKFVKKNKDFIQNLVACLDFEKQKQKSLEDDYSKLKQENEELKTQNDYLKMVNNKQLDLFKNELDKGINENKVIYKRRIHLMERQLQNDQNELQMYKQTEKKYMEVVEQDNEKIEKLNNKIEDLKNKEVQLVKNYLQLLKFLENVKNILSSADAKDIPQLRTLNTMTDSEGENSPDVKRALKSALSYGISTLNVRDLSILHDAIGEVNGGLCHQTDKCTKSPTAATSYPDFSSLSIHRLIVEETTDNIPKGYETSSDLSIDRIPIKQRPEDRKVNFRGNP